MPANPLSPAQHAQIRELVVTLTSERGLDGWRIRDVEAASGVSSRTLYKYFPSKEYLLLSSLVTQIGSLDALLPDRRPRGRTPSARALKIVRPLTEAQLAVPTLSRAMVRALTSGQEAVAPMLLEFHRVLREALASALGNGAPSDADWEAAEIIEQVWFAATVAWASNIQPDTYIESAVHRVLRLVEGRPVTAG
ncbi:MAG: TetR/AcrR family transcriptional regulator [Acidimicrobiales bacterium]